MFWIVELKNLMKKKLITFIKIMIGPKYREYSHVIWKNRFKNVFKKQHSHKYLFILSPPYCGSTLLNEIISTASQVSVNNKWGTREGQTLPTVRHIMFDNIKRWDTSLDFDWQFIKKEWLKYWDLSSPILLEKSPPNIIRANSIERNFSPSYFIVFHRNPYAHCESLMRRKKIDARSAAIFAIKCLTYQKENLLSLERTIALSYEQLTENTNKTVALIRDFLPELTDIKHEQSFNANNYLGRQMEVVNLNKDKISKLTGIQIKEINDVFRDNKAVLAFFNYELIE